MLKPNQYKLNRRLCLNPIAMISLHHCCISCMWKIVHIFTIWLYNSPPKQQNTLNKPIELWKHLQQRLPSQKGRPSEEWTRCLFVLVNANNLHNGFNFVQKSAESFQGQLCFPHWLLLTDVVISLIQKTKSTNLSKLIKNKLHENNYLDELTIEIWILIRSSVEKNCDQY